MNNLMSIQLNFKKLNLVSSFKKDKQEAEFYKNVLPPQKL